MRTHGRPMRRDNAVPERKGLKRPARIIAEYKSKAQQPIEFLLNYPYSGSWPKQIDIRLQGIP
ncbi:hypothetical protein IQ22_03707 [Pseudomonas duriflava]|uniref:Uncharacterized protein n=1 Tax=Pseudomonas duriflava TaxID=459528 RepID=A0A562Q2U1_9PSED|nr:hypothetical protein IQ22_03707 [Pseudomonas duriflava]